MSKGHATGPRITLLSLLEQISFSIWASSLWETAECSTAEWVSCCFLCTWQSCTADVKLTVIWALDLARGTIQLRGLFCWSPAGALSYDTDSCCRQRAILSFIEVVLYSTWTDTVASLLVWTRQSIMPV